MIDDEFEIAKNFNEYFVNIVKKNRNIKRKPNYAFCSIAKVFNEYFVNIAKNLGILKENQTMHFADNQLSKKEMAIIKCKTTLA